MNLINMITNGRNWSKEAVPAFRIVDPPTWKQGEQSQSQFAPQLGIAWDPKGDGKTVVRAGIGLYYENVIFNNVLFDPPARLQKGEFLRIQVPCGDGPPLLGPDPTQIAAGQLNASACSDTIGFASMIVMHATANSPQSPTRIHLGHWFFIAYASHLD